MSPPRNNLSRRAFLRVAGAAGLAAGCSPAAGPQKLVPYLNAPDDIIPGTPLFYRTTCRECGAACGVTARTREGRVVKLEGNPEDPISQGALCARGQAAIQALYAPDRLRGPLRRRADGGFEPATWNDAIGAVAGAIATAAGKGRAGAVRLLTRPEPGSAGALQRAFLAAAGAGATARVVFDPFDRAPLRAAGDTLFGRAELPVYDLGAARSIVSFGAEFLETWGSPVELARGFAAGRGRTDPERTRLTWISPRLGATGVSADRWIAARAGAELWLAVGLLRWVCASGAGVTGLAPEAGTLLSLLSDIEIPEMERRAGIAPGEIARLGQELLLRRPSAVLGPGIQSAGVTATTVAVTVQLINYVLGNIGRTVLYGLDPLEDPPSSFAAVQALAADMAAGNVDVLLLNHADPAGTLPADSTLAPALGRVPLIVSFSDWLDPTTRHAHVVLPDHHALESFGDLTPRRGVVELLQPVMNPLADTRSAPQSLLDIWAQLPNAPKPPTDDFYTFVQTRTATLLPGLAGDPLTAAQREAQARGGYYSTAQPVPVTLRPPTADWFGPPVERAEPDDRLALLAFPTALRYRGPGADRSWLNEVPDPLTSVSWSGWAELAPATLRRLGGREGDVLRVKTAAGSADLPVVVAPAIRDDVIAVPLACPEALTLVPLATDPRSGAVAWNGGRATVTIAPAGRPARLPRPRGSPYQEGRGIVRTVSSAAPTLPPPSASAGMYPPPRFPEHRWAMVIDMDRCTGCQACVVACYAENNVPVVGPEAPPAGRSMGWIRLEHFFAEGGEAPAEFLLMLCQHCGNAPCEPVCPVYATYHNTEGLNAQVYNRCVGTRYCSNNCPYKVRVFNWLDPAFPAPLNLQLNPDVTVRSKGVMEKCTFCAHRIRAAKIAAENRGRPLADGEVETACAQACPTRAITFGDADDPRARVTTLQRDGRAYRVLDTLNTAPAITYLARVRDTAGPRGGPS